MPFKPIHLLAPLLGVALGFVSPWTPPEVVKVRHSRIHGGSAPAAANPWGAWGDARFLDQAMEEACEWAKVATGVAFVQRPTAVVSDVDTVAAFLREDYDAAFRRMGAADEAGVVAMARTAAAQVIAAYDPKDNVVHVLPAVAQIAEAPALAQGSPGLMSDDVLRLLLVRMAVIAQDRQVFPEWKTALDTADSLDALSTAGAVLQGHAQYIAERVLKQWNKDRQVPLTVFDDMVALLTHRPLDPGPVSNALHAEVTFAVLQGHEFMALAARKPRPGIANLLKTPPKQRSVILDPQGYFDSLAGRVAPSRLPGKVGEAFQQVVWAGEGWTFEETDVMAADVEALLAPLEKMMYATVVAGYESGKTITAQKDGVQHALFVLEFRKPGLAEAFVNLRKGAVERAGGSAEMGAGRDGGLHGFTASQADGEAKRWMQWTHEGGYVLGLATPADMSDFDAREPWDDAVEAAAETIAKAEKSRSNRRKDARKRK